MELKASRKREREKSTTPAPPDSLPSPAKKSSPDGVTASTGPQPKASLKPVQPSFTDLAVPPTQRSPPASETDDSSDQEPPPLPATKESAPKVLTSTPPYEGLNSVVCAYKAGTLKFSESGLTRGLAAKLCNEEIEASRKWSRKDQVKFRPMIVSALRLLYPRKQESWFNSAFLSSPSGAAEYWRRVLALRSAAWSAAFQKQQEAKNAYLTPLKQRIRAAIEARERARLGNLSGATVTPPSGSKNSPIPLSSNSSSSSEDNGEMLTTEPSSSRSITKAERLAPGPETYTPSEIKNFARVAKSIRRVNDGAAPSHAAATADLIDVEFSDNMGRARRAWAAPKSSWKKERFKQMCSQAAKIMEDRSVFILCTLNYECDHFIWASATTLSGTPKQC